MPRPRRAQGRPGTRVIPADWAESHAPAVAKTRTARVQIFNPTDQATPQLQDDYSYSPPVATTPVYDGTARVQAMGGQDAADVLGDQIQRTMTYLVAIDRNTVVRIGAQVLVTGSDDTYLSGRPLIVRKIATGSLQWERDLWCTDDMTRTPDTDQED